MNEWIRHESHGFINPEEIIGQVIFESLDPPLVRCQLEFDIRSLPGIEALAVFDPEAHDIIAVFTDLTVVEVEDDENQYEFLFQLNMEEDAYVSVAETYQLHIFRKYNTFDIEGIPEYPVVWDLSSAMISLRKDGSISIRYDNNVNFQLYEMVGACVLSEEGSKKVEMIVAFDNPFLLWQKFVLGNEGESVDADGIKMVIICLNGSVDTIDEDKWYRIHPLASTSRIN